MKFLKSATFVIIINILTSNVLPSAKWAEMMLVQSMAYFAGGKSVNSSISYLTFSKET